MITVRVNYNDTNANIEFPCDESYLYSKLAELRVADEEMASPKLFVEEVTDFDELKCLEENFVDLDELNYFAKQLYSLDMSKKFTQGSDLFIPPSCSLIYIIHYN